MLSTIASDSLVPLGWFLFLSHYWPVLVVAFSVALLATPVARFIARKNNIVDHPDQARKLHKKPIAYLGGVAVFLAVLAGIISSFVFVKQPGFFQPFPIVIIIGMCAIGLTGLADDIFEYFEKLRFSK